MLRYVRLRGLPHPAGLVRVVKQLAHRHTERLEVPRVREQNPGSVRDLIDDPTDRRSHDWPRLPHSLRDRKPESFGEALLRDDRSVPLQRVDHRGVLVGILERQRDEQNPAASRLRQLSPLQQAVREHGGAFWVVGYPGNRRADEQQISVLARHDVVRESRHHP